MLNIYPGMKRESLSRVEQLTFDNYDKNGDGVISYGEFNNYIAVTGAAEVKNKMTDKKENKGFNLEQFDPQGSINFESNGGFNSKRLNIIA